MTPALRRHAPAAFAAVAVAVFGLTLLRLRTAPERSGAGPGVGATASDPAAELGAGAVLAFGDLDPALAGRRAATDAPAAPELAPTTSLGAMPRIVGRVVDDDGAPVADARVRVASLARVDFDFEPSSGPASDVEARSDASGAFELIAPAVGGLRARVRASGFVPLDVEGVHAPAGALDLGVLVLQRAAVLRGRIVGTDAGPVAGALVLPVRDATHGAFAPPGFQLRVLATADSSGTFQIDELAPGPWSVEVRSEAHPPRRFDGVADARSLDDVVLTLGAGAVIAGRVAGVPAGETQGLEVEATPAADGEWTAASVRRSAAVGVDGRFEVRGLAEGPHDLVVHAGPVDRAAGTRRVRSEPVRATSGDRDVVLHYRRGTGLTFRVVDAVLGEPISRFEVAYGVGRPRALGDAEGEPLRDHRFGIVHVPDLEEGASGDLLSLSVVSEGYEPYHRDDVPLVGEHIDLGDIGLRPVPMLKVTVRDASSGAPVDGARVSLTVDQGSATGASERRLLHAVADAWGNGAEVLAINPALAGVGRTAGDGVARVAAVAGARSVLRIESPRHAPREFHGLVVAPGEEAEQEVALAEGGTVEVVVLDALGEPRAGVALDRRTPAERDGELLPLPGGMGLEPVTGADGRVRLRHLEPGRHGFRVRVAVPDAGQGAEVVRAIDAFDWVEIDVVDGSLHSLVLREAPRARLQGRVREDDQPLLGANLALFERDGLAIAPVARTRSDARGAFVLEDLSAGTYTLEVEHRDRAMEERLDVELAPGDNEIAVRLAASTLTGVVRDGAGQPLSGMRVAARLAAWPLDPSTWTYDVVDHGRGPQRHARRAPHAPAADAFTDAAGRYVLRGLTASRPVVVHAWGPGHVAGVSAPIDLGAEAPRDGLDVVLERAGALRFEVSTADGSPVRGWLVEARRGSTPEARPRVEFAASPSMTLDGLAPGHWSVQVWREGVATDAPPSLDVDVAAGHTETVSVRLP